ncbi:MAG: CocE/NonD family hydrolase [Rhizobiaceae bacterium]|nr:CocE/NonD family hydrolase [Rhizobiaceae bacterium]MCZ8352555.1 CocE/NonD family hydrolase [Rhizobium sp.]
MIRMLKFCAVFLASTQAHATEIIETMMPLSDGPSLMTLVVLPEGEGPFSAIVVRTPYSLPTPAPGPVELDDDKATREDIIATWAPALSRGFAVVQQNTRGRGESTGLDMMFQTDRADGVEFASWLVAQPWSDGTFRLTGDSADGFAGYLMAAEKPKGLTGAFFQVSCANLQKLGVVRRTGGLQMEALVPWVMMQAGESGPENKAALIQRSVDLAEAGEKADQVLANLFSGDPEALIERPLSSLDPVYRLQPEWRGFISEEGYEARAKYFDATSDIAVPITHVGLWQDTFLDCTVDAFLRAKGEQTLIVMNGTHYEIDRPSTWNVAAFHEAFVDWLDDKAVPPVQVTVENAPTPLLIESAEWPPRAATPETFWLAKDGLSPDADESSEVGTFITDPTKPLPSEGGRNLVIEAGSKMDRLPNRNAYQIVTLGEPVQTDTIILGEVNLDVTFKADQQDADVVARLIAVDPEGEPRQILENLFRARYRDGREAPSPIVPGMAVSGSFALGHTAHFLKAGERIGLILQGSNAPRWDMATGHDADPTVATTALPISVTIEQARLTINMIKAPSEPQ